MQPDTNAIPRRSIRRFALQLLASTTITTLLAGLSYAQDAAPAPDASEPPALVGRVSAINGQVSMQRANEQDWSPAGVNEPITIGDAVYVQPQADARLQIGATDMDLLSDSEVDIATLDQQTGQIRLDTGSLELRVLEIPTADGLSILTPRGTVRLTQPGIFRIDAGSETEPSQVTVWTGSAQLGETAAAVNVKAGQVLIITGTPDAPQYSFGGNIGAPPDTWRDSPKAVSADHRYISAAMTGGEDLYTYGAFETVPQYGAVWYPKSVPADWQPYRYGHWEYVAPWGQTWIDDQPWGFAPFHYGRWAYIGGRWGWTPGEYVAHPVYAPALVAFVGGGGFSASISFHGGEAVGWVPLAPGERFRPWYRTSPTYVENVNRTVIVNKTVINNTVVERTTVNQFANARFATVAPAAVIASGRPVAQAVIRVQPQQLERVSVDQQVVTQIQRPPQSARPHAQPGPVAPVHARPGLAPAAVVRPALPVARGRGPAAPGAARPANAPAPQAPAEARPMGQPQRPVEPQRAGQPPAAPQQPNVSRPEANRPEANKPEANRPEANRPEANRPEANRPEANRPEANKPEVSRPEPNRPEANKPEANRPEPNKPEANRPEGNKAEANRPEPDRREPNRPESNRPEPDRHEANRPEANRAEPNRPEAARPEARRAESGKPEAAKPEAPKPEAREARPEAPKPPARAEPAEHTRPPAAHPGEPAQDKTPPKKKPDDQNNH